MTKPDMWFLSPVIAVMSAVFIIAVNAAPGLDGTAKSTAIVFWFLPTIVWLGCMCFSNLEKVNYSRLSKILILSIWLIPSLPLSLMSLYGIMLLSETGFGILF